MPLFARIDDRHLIRALKRKYQAMEAGPEKDAVAHAIADDDARENLRAMLETGAVPNVGAPAPNGILAQLIVWLENNWQAILAAILALFKP